MFITPFSTYFTLSFVCVNVHVSVYVYVNSLCVCVDVYHYVDVYVWLSFMCIFGADVSVYVCEKFMSSCSRFCLCVPHVYVIC